MSREVKTKPEAIWFGPAQRPLAGFLHSPSGPCTGGALICAPFGYENASAHRSLRRLAETLARRGLLVLRFDYEGTGGSAGIGSEPDLLQRWQDSVATGVAELRRRGIDRPALVGVRVGAALACALASTDPNLGPLALWAPVTSGRRYHRELRGQAATSPGGIVGDGSFNTFGHLLPAQALQDLKVWQPLTGVDPSHKILVVQSPGWRDVEDCLTDFKSAGISPTLLELEGTAGVLERDAEVADVPVALVDAIADWLVTNTDPMAPISLDSIPASDPVRVIDTGAGLVEEEIVEVGPLGLYGVLTRPIGQAAEVGLVFLNNGVTPAAGPGRAWADFGRALAGDGVCSLRLDFTGVADSPDLDERPVIREEPFPDGAGRQTKSAIDFLKATGVAHVTAIGLCSGGQIAVRQAAYGGAVDAVFVINPSLHYPVDYGTGPWMSRFLWKRTAFAVNKAPILKAMHRLPERLWTILDRLGLFPTPDRYLRRAADRGTNIQLVYSIGDRSLADLRCRAGSAIDSLVAADKISLLEVAMDHSMFDRSGRAIVLAAMRESLAARLSEQPTVAPS